MTNKEYKKRWRKHYFCKSALSILPSLNRKSLCFSYFALLSLLLLLLLLFYFRSDNSSFFFQIKSAPHLIRKCKTVLDAHHFDLIRKFAFETCQLYHPQIQIERVKVNFRYVVRSIYQSPKYMIKFIIWFNLLVFFGKYNSFHVTAN